eukprot:Clim_evm59s128 gene=Clim_evmTU59s128
MVSPYSNPLATKLIHGHKNFGNVRATAAEKQPPLSHYDRDNFSAVLYASGLPEYQTHPLLKDVYKEGDKYPVSKVKVPKHANGTRERKTAVDACAPDNRAYLHEFNHGITELRNNLKASARAGKNGTEIANARLRLLASYMNMVRLMEKGRRASPGERKRLSEPLASLLAELQLTAATAPLATVGPGPTRTHFFRNNNAMERDMYKTTARFEPASGRPSKFNLVPRCRGQGLIQRTKPRAARATQKQSNSVGLQKTNRPYKSSRGQRTVLPQTNRGTGTVSPRKSLGRLKLEPNTHDLRNDKEFEELIEKIERIENSTQATKDRLRRSDSAKPPTMKRKVARSSQHVTESEDMKPKTTRKWSVNFSQKFVNALDKAADEHQAHTCQRFVTVDYVNVPWDDLNRVADSVADYFIYEEVDELEKRISEMAENLVMEEIELMATTPTTID